MQGITTIIFDLGGVIINLDTQKTINEFNKLTGKQFEKIYSQNLSTAIIITTQ